MNRERIIIIITLVATVIINLTGLLLGKSWNNVVYFFIPILLILIFYFLIVSQMINMEKNIFEKIKSISPNFEIITGEDFVKKTLTETINEAKDVIFTTGGRAREVDYLNALTQKVLNEDVKYYRVILGDHIQHTFHEHLKELIDRKEPSVYVGYQLEEKYGNILVTNDKVILYLPSASFKGLDMVLKIADPDLAKKYQLYVMQIYAESKKITNSEDLDKLCIHCKG
ncbi:unnamed protein product, partial [marine sediment metagenome]